MAAKEPADQQHRVRILGDLDTTMLVEAAAGTGKTTALVGRMLNLVRTGRAGSGSMAAITFTVKAAAHLRERFQEELERGVAAARDAVEAEGLRQALADIDRGFIGTTHAFCARLLRERPVEAGLDPEFSELDSAEAVQLATRFWNRWYDARAAAGDPALGEAAGVSLGRDSLAAIFLRLMEYPDVVLASTRTPRPDLAPLIRALEDQLDAIEQHLPKTPPAKGYDKFQEMAIEANELRRSTDLTVLERQLELLERADCEPKRTLNRWPVDATVVKALEADYVSFRNSVLKPGLLRWYEHVHGIAMEVLQPAVAGYAAERRRAGTLTFQDLLLSARDLLRDHPAVRLYFQRRFTHVLVDEFQDTDPLQAEVLFYLTGEQAEEREWRKLTPRAGSLFIVGDPKQAIYRFRRADITTYLDVKKRILESGGAVVPLSSNFRSDPSVCGFVNTVFPQLFDAAEVAAERQAAHVDLLPHHGAANPAGVYLVETQHGRGDDMAFREAECVATWVDRAVRSGFTIDDCDRSRPLEWRDVLLVSWQRTRLRFYAHALEQRGIPYEITGSRAFGGENPLRLAMPLLRAVAAPEDAVSVLAFLRGPLCGADDDALYRYARAGGRFSPFAEAPEGTDGRIVRGLALVRSGIDESRELPPAAALGRLLDRCGLIALAAASAEQPGTRAGNLLLALTIARTESSKGASFAEVVETLAELLEAKADVEELNVDPARSNAVRLMNLHQVKGLEAPVVFLVDPNDEYDFPIDLYVDRSGAESRAHALISVKKNRKEKTVGIPPGWAGYEQTERAFKTAEKNRLLYVAATRARSLLMVGFRRDSQGAIKGAWRELARRASNLFLPLDAEVTAAASDAAVVRQFDDAMADLARRQAAAKSASYSVLPITKLAHGDHQGLVRAEEGLGRGTSWGRVLHLLFEAMLRDEALDVRLHASNLLKDEERDPVELDEVLRVTDAVRASSLWQRVRSAEDRMAEVPFALNVPRADVGLKGEGDTLLHGTIDLVFRENGQWFIVDYKSDSTSGRLDDLVAYYAPQVRHYARFWERLTGARANAGLFFVDGMYERWV